MIGKPEWFSRRKYGGWGLTPKTKEGWIYLAVWAIPFIGFQSMTSWSEQTRLTVTIAWIAVLLFDVFDIMIRMKQDEREEQHEAKSERNASWFMMITLVVGFLYYTISAAIKGEIYVEPFIVIALFGGAAVKSISNYYYDKKS